MIRCPSVEMSRKGPSPSRATRLLHVPERLHPLLLLLLGEALSALELLEPLDELRLALTLVNQALTGGSIRTVLTRTRGDKGL